MSESLRSVLPGYLLMVVSSMLNDLATELQKMSNDDGKDNSPLKQALHLLTAGQQNISDRVLHELSLEEQLSYVYTIHSLAQSLIGYRGSLEELQSSPLVASLIILLLGLGSPQESGSGQEVSQEVLSVGVFAFSSMVYEKGVMLVPNPIVMEALQFIDESSDYSLKYLTHTLKYKSTHLEIEGQEPGNTLDEEVNSKLGKGTALLSFYKSKILLLSKNLKGKIAEAKDGHKNPALQDGDYLYYLPTMKIGIVAQETHSPTSIPDVSLTHMGIMKQVDVGGQEALGHDCIVRKKCLRIDCFPAPCSDQVIPPPKPRTSWCWKRRLESLSVANVQHFIKKASLTTLKELDTECHETICHAIVSVFKGSSAVSLIRALHKRSVIQFHVLDKNGDTPLHKAVNIRDLMVVKELFDLHSAAVYIENSTCYTPVDIAMHNNYDEVVECLVRSTVEYDPHSTCSVQLLQSCLIKSMKIGYTKYLKMLLQLCSEHVLTIDFECTDSDGCTAWHYLAQKELTVQHDVVDILCYSAFGHSLLHKLFRNQQLDARVFPHELISTLKNNFLIIGTHIDISGPSLDQRPVASTFYKESGPQDKHDTKRMPLHCSSNCPSFMNDNKESDSQTSDEQVMLADTEQPITHMDQEVDSSVEDDQAETENSSHTQHLELLSTKCCTTTGHKEQQPDSDRDPEISSVTNQCNGPKPSEHSSTPTPEMVCSVDNEPAATKSDCSHNMQTQQVEQQSSTKSSAVTEQPITNRAPESTAVEYKTESDLDSTPTQQVQYSSTERKSPNDASVEITPACSLQAGQPPSLQIDDSSSSKSSASNSSNLKLDLSKSQELSTRKEIVCQRDELNSIQSPPPLGASDLPAFYLLALDEEYDSSYTPPKSYCLAEYKPAVPAPKNDQGSIHKVLLQVTEEFECTRVSDKQVKTLDTSYSQHTSAEESQSDDATYNMKPTSSNHRAKIEKAVQTEIPTTEINYSIRDTSDDHTSDSIHDTFDSDTHQTVESESQLHSLSTKSPQLTISDVSSCEYRAPTPDSAVVEAFKSKRVLEYSTTDDSCNGRKKQSLMYQQQYTDSVTSSPSDHSLPRTRIVSKSKRARARRRLLRHRLPTSESDTQGDSCRKKRRSRRRKAKTKSHTDCQTDTVLSLTDSGSRHTLSHASSNSCKTGVLSSHTDSSAGHTGSGLNNADPKLSYTDSESGHTGPVSSQMNPGTRNTEPRHSCANPGLRYTDPGSGHNDPGLSHNKLESSKNSTIPQSCTQTNSFAPTIQKRSCVNALSRGKYTPRRGYKHRVQRTIITRESFCSIVGRKLTFHSEGFKNWLSCAIHSIGYHQLRRLVHPKLLPVFGFSPLTRNHLTVLQRKMARALIETVSRCKKNSIPQKVVLNLMKLETQVFEDHQTTTPSRISVLLRGKGLRSLKKDAVSKNKSAGTGARKGASNFHGAASHCEGASSVEKTIVNDEISVLTLAQKQESSTGDSVCQFSNANNPLDVIHSHMIHYCKCCPRHDILDTVVTGTTFPASDAFVSKKRYSTIKDITSDQRHGKLDATKELRARTGDDRRYGDNRSRQVMLDDPMPESTRRGRLALPRNNASVAVETRLEEPHSSLLQSLHQNSSSAQAVAQRKTPDTESRINESNGDLERKVTAEAQLQHKSLATVEHADTGYSTRSSVPSRAPQPLSTQSEPGDHKDRLRSAAELLHAQDYPRIVIICYGGEPPAHLSPHLKIPYVFITGLAYYKMSNHKKSVQYFGKCLGLAEECHRDGDVTICNIYLGDIDFAKRKYTEAAGKYQNALNQYSRDSVAKDFRMILPTKSAVWLKCGSAFKNASRVGDAVHAYESAVELAASKKDQLSARTSLGNLFQGIGENERAKIQYEEAIKLATELEDHISLGWNHGNLGNALLGLHQRDKALHHLFKALDMAVDHEMTPQAIGRAYNNLGTAFQSLNELSKAEEHYDLALAQAIYGNDIPGQARVYGNIGNLQMLNKHYDRAVPHYTEVMRLSQDKATITTAHHNRGCAYYDWAEKKKNSFFERIHQDSSVRSSKTSSSLALLGSHAKETDEVTPAASSKSSGFKISLHGPDFEHSEEVYRPMFVPEAIQKYYLQGTRDLEYVIKHHEESFNGIKGSSKGLSLSVSLFETNSRTFHRMQDCLVHLQKSEKEPSRYEDALLVAEQSRARTLGELLLRRRGPQLEHELVSPPSIHQLKSVVARQSCPVVYLSYTGERLMGWILYPTCNNHCSVNMFQVPLSDSEFDGKSFDYHLRYSLNEQLVEKSFEMYKPFIPEKDKTKTEPLEKLYDLVARPLMTMLKELDQQKQNHNQEEDEDCTRGKSASKPTVTQNQRKVIIIPDSYTNLLPFTCVLNKETGKFWGDEYYFQIMPSLLTMGILDQLPTVSVSIPVQHQQMLCVVGNPTIPRFKFNNDEWDLGKLPHATKEAEWVSHILQCKPILHEQATKDAVMMRLMNAKVIHLATHGSAAAGFLAFAGMNSSTNEAVDSRKVLIYPHEVESLNISPALVVLSSCDSGRGVFKADGIQGMARAFILAGAQAVLTALWRVPDESACIFMQFFYEYLVDGLRGTEALHKAILSLRCFSKYSQYIHWSGYQLTGREFQFDINHSSARAELTTRLGASSVFPRLEILNNLKNALINNPRPPSDVQVCSASIFINYCFNLSFSLSQVLHGPPGVKPSEPLIDFIHCHHLHFTGGIFWINCRTQQLIEASLTAIKHVSSCHSLIQIYQ